MKELSYGTFYTDVEKGKIDKVTVTVASNIYIVEGTYKEGTEFTTTAPKEDDVFAHLRAHKVAYDSKEMEGPPWWTGALTALLPILLIVGLFLLMMNQTQGGGNRVMQFGRSRARMAAPEEVTTTFKDVAGADEAKEELQEVIEFLKNPQKFIQIGAKIPKGVLPIWTPQGTGKNPDGQGGGGRVRCSSHIRPLCGNVCRGRSGPGKRSVENAKKNAPCIVFIDEIDAVGQRVLESAAA